MRVDSFSTWQDYENLYYMACYMILLLWKDLRGRLLSRFLDRSTIMHTSGSKCTDEGNVTVDMILEFLSESWDTLMHPELIAVLDSGLFDDENDAMRAQRVQWIRSFQPANQLEVRLLDVNAMPHYVIAIAVRQRHEAKMAAEKSHEEHVRIDKDKARAWADHYEPVFQSLTGSENQAKSASNLLNDAQRKSIHSVANSERHKRSYNHPFNSPSNDIASLKVANSAFCKAPLMQSALETIQTETGKFQQRYLEGKTYVPAKKAPNREEKDAINGVLTPPSSNDSRHAEPMAQVAMPRAPIATPPDSVERSIEQLQHDDALWSSTVRANFQRMRDTLELRERCEALRAETMKDIPSEYLTQGDEYDPQPIILYSKLVNVVNENGPSIFLPENAHIIDEYFARFDETIQFSQQQSTRAPKDDEDEVLSAERVASLMKSHQENLCQREAHTDAWLTHYIYHCSEEEILNHLRCMAAKERDQMYRNQPSQPHPLSQPFASESQRKVSNQMLHLLRPRLPQEKVERVALQGKALQSVLTIGEPCGWSSSEEEVIDFKKRKNGRGLAGNRSFMLRKKHAREMREKIAMVAQDNDHGGVALD